MKARSSHLAHPTRRLSVCTACSRTGMVDRITRKCAAPVEGKKLLPSDIYGTQRPENKRVAACTRIQRRRAGLFADKPAMVARGFYVEEEG